MKFWNTLRRLGLIAFALLLVLAIWSAEPDCPSPCGTTAPKRMPVIH